MDRMDGNDGLDVFGWNKMKSQELLHLYFEVDLSMTFESWAGSIQLSIFKDFFP